MSGPRSTLVCCLAVFGAAVLVACGGPPSAAGRRPPTTKSVDSRSGSSVGSAAGVALGLDTAPPAPAPAPSPRAAVQTLLGAELRLDHERSYALLSAAGRSQYHDVADWTRRRSQLPPITQFRIEGDGPGPGSVVVLVQHRPSLDPFVGLSPARERQTWTASHVPGGWLVGPEPQVEPQWPADTLAASAALNWARAVQACDQAKARAAQAVDPPLGLEQVGPIGLCGTSSALATGPVGTVPAGPDSAELVAQYSTDALGWARSVPIAGGPRPFSVVLAPIGDGWQVVGVAP